MEQPKVIVDEKLSEIALLVAEGKTPSVSVRELLGWVLAQRRGWYVVSLIRGALSEVGLVTVPDFESVYIDANVSFVKEGSASANDTIEDDTSGQSGHGDGDAGNENGEGSGNYSAQATAFITPDYIVSDGLANNDPTYRISKLEAAGIPPVSVSPNDTLECAITLMLSNNFSQLPVMTSEREVKGVISWFSIATRLALGKEGLVVKDLMEPHQEMRESDSIFSAISIVNQHDYVLVRDGEKRITGMVTAADLNHQFQNLAEPFLLLGEIENQIRRFIDNKFTSGELEAAKNPADTERTVLSVSSLTFGEYVKLLENPDNWNKLELKLDRKTFISKLEQIRKIRNDVMHFDPDPLAGKQQKALRDFAQFLQRIHSLQAN
ncbi:CBS domain-containing protein [Hymenobacter sp. ASUV-10]|uniref:CBS domain-containing protein n=1 Tax=Hymenobacter aranciens TaxID=3063996 RepID=A0ABT9BBG8_9BACT|nr:CBS domain-containing protein [Hymenobacter sp. ASUV-10]MDO7875614.1 CBS domain-containing protein [Hymenobacter sp. ASUV-10]